VVAEPGHRGCAIVAGASRGFGLAIAQALAAEGRPVVMTGRDPGRLQEAAASVRQLGAEVMTAVADAADEEAVDVVVSTALEEFGGIDVLVNNAGAPPLLERFGPELTWEAWRRHIDVDLLGVFNGCRRVLPLMREQGSGTIVNLSSGAIYASSRHHHAYTAAKLAIVGLSRCLASDAADAGVAVHCLCPDITPEGEVGRLAIEAFAADRGLTADEWLERSAPKPPSSAAAVGGAVVSLLGEPSGVWHVGGAGLRRWDAIVPPPRS
jgi:NAD(P)-dependent dehydrogenase (short-subunit alcohol dehydrogenase family)